MPETPRVPDFELVRPIGRGGYGEVWLARSITGVWRAVKIVDRTRFDDARPFEREFAGVRSYQRTALGQPHQLALLHVGRDDDAGQFHYVMELADDATAPSNAANAFDPEHYVPLTLKELRWRRGIVPADEVVRLGLALARSLAFLHGHKLIHRDVKPSNVVLVQGLPKLADLGLVSSSETTLSNVGTPGYAPPEGPGTQSADRYGLGKVLYELTTGLAPTDFPRLPADVAERPDAESLRELNAVLLKACANRREDRYQTTDEMVADLELLQAGKSVAAYEARQRRLRRLGLTLAGLAMGALLLASLLAWRNRAVQQQRQETRAAEYRAELAATRRALDAGDFGSAYDKLEGLRPTGGDSDLRGFEWQALHQEVAGGSAATWRPTRSSLVTLATIQGSDALMAVSEKGEVFTTGANSNAPFPRLTLDRIPYLVAAEHGLVWASPDGWARAVAGSTQIATLPGGAVLDFARGGRLALLWEKVIAGGQTHRSAVIRSIPDATEVSRFQPSNDGRILVTGALSADGRLAALAWYLNRGATRERRVDLWEVAAGQLRWQQPITGRVDWLRFDPDSEILAATVGGTEVRVLDTRTGLPLAHWPASDGQIHALTFSPNGQRLATAGDDQSVRVWDPRTGVAQSQYRGHRAPIRALNWDHPDRLHSAAADGEVRTWHPSETYRQTTAAIAYVGTFVDLQLSPEGQSLLVRDRAGALAEIDALTLTKRRVLDPPGVLPVAFSPGNRTLWTFDASWGLQRRTWPRGTVAASYPSQSTEGPEVWVASSRWIAAGSLDGRIETQALPENDLPPRPVNTWRAHPQGVTALALSHDHLQLASASDAGDLWLWTLPATGLPVGAARAALTSAANSLSWSPDDRQLAAVLSDGSLILEDLKSGHRHHVPAANQVAMTAVAYHPDGSRLFTGGRDGRVIFWGLHPLQPLYTEYLDAQGATGLREVAALTTSADGSAVAALSRNGQVRVWHSR